MRTGRPRGNAADARAGRGRRTSSWGKLVDGGRRGEQHDLPEPVGIADAAHLLGQPVAVGPGLGQPMDAVGDEVAGLEAGGDEARAKILRRLAAEHAQGGRRLHRGRPAAQSPEEAGRGRGRCVQPQARARPARPRPPSRVLGPGAGSSPRADPRSRGRAADPSAGRARAVPDQERADVGAATFTSESSSGA